MLCSLARPLQLGTVSTSPITEAVPLSLCAREPRVPADRLVAEMVPPPRFDSVRFDTYVPDPNQPSQTEAVSVLGSFAAGLGGAHASGAAKRKWFSKKPAAPTGPRGVYLDGGYGVGKTHLLASLWHATPAEAPLKAFGTFVELTNLVGALGFQQTVQTLSGHRLLCIDEFELDDPGDTVLVSTLLGKLVDAGVALAATSNTLPGKLGEGRFAAADFLREIQGLSAHFRPLRIDGEDYRHRGLPEAPPPTPTSRSPRPRTPPKARPSTTSRISSSTSRRSIRAGTGRSPTVCARSASPMSGPSPTSRRRCAWSYSPTGCTTGRCRCSPRACPSTGCSATRC